MERSERRKIVDKKNVTDVLEIPISTITYKIAKFTENGKFAESHNFRNFEPQI
jgi:hypothetical protein